MEIWNDNLLWQIRPDCIEVARACLEKLTPAADGLHRDNLMKGVTKSYARWFNMDELPVDIDGSVAIVSVVGPLVNSWNPWTANYPALTATFEKLAEDASIKKVLVRFKTPGGTVSGLEECAAALSQLAEKKITVAQVDGGCYSAGYFLASQCGSIFCSATDHVGNIGTVTTVYDYSQYFADAGIRSITKKTGAIKGIGTLGDPVTPIQEQFLDTLTQQHFEHFKTAVVDGRSMTDEEFEAVSDGSFWLGETAVALNITDGVSSFKQTLAALHNAA